jgi:hypothetical protein
MPTTVPTLALMAGLLLGSASWGQTSSPVTVAEVATLLRAGIPSASIVPLIDLRGGPDLITDEDLEQVTAAGGTDALLQKLARLHEGHQKLRHLAELFDIYEDRNAGLSFLYPKGWSTSPTEEEGRYGISILEYPERGQGWFATPRLFVWVQQGTPFSPVADPELGRRIANIMFRRFRNAKMAPKAFTVGLENVGRRPATEYRFEAKDPVLHFEGHVVLRTQAGKDGRIVAVVLTCGIGDLDRVWPLFDEVARSISP